MCIRDRPIPQYCGPVRKHPACRIIIPLMVAANGAAETFGFVINHGPRPNSPDIFNHTNNDYYLSKIVAKSVLRVITIEHNT